MPHRRNLQPVAAHSVGFTHVPYLCRRCHWGGDIGVMGEGFTIRTPPGPGMVGDARKKAEATALKMVIPDAAASAALAKCPRCGARDAQELAMLQRAGMLRSAACLAAIVGLRVCGGPLGWEAWALGLAGSALIGGWSVWRRLRRADKAVFFTVDTDGNAAPPKP